MFATASYQFSLVLAPGEKLPANDVSVFTGTDVGTDPFFRQFFLMSPGVYRIQSTTRVVSQPLVASEIQWWFDGVPLPETRITTTGDLLVGTALVKVQSGPKSLALVNVGTAPLQLEIGTNVVSIVIERVQ